MKEDKVGGASWEDEKCVQNFGRKT